MNVPKITVLKLTTGRWAGHWTGYISGRVAEHFGTGGEAYDWQQARIREAVLSAYGPDLARLQAGRNRTVLEIDTTDPALAAVLVGIAEERQLPVLAVAVEKGRAKRVPHIRVTVRAADVDVEVTGVGDTVLRFEPLSGDALDWVSEHVQLEPWQWIGGSFGVEHRYAGNLIERLAADGLRVRVL